MKGIYLSNNSTPQECFGIELWGIYPPPVGGVSIHIKRLILSLNNFGYVTLKDFKPKKHYQFDFIKPVCHPLWEIVSLLIVKRRIIHIEQFSYIFFLSFLLFGWRHKFGITIHNQRSILITSKIKILICKLFFRRCRFIIMNDKSFSKLFLEKFCVDPQKIFILPAYIPPSDYEMKGLPEVVKTFRKEHEFLLSANAYKLRKDDGIDVYGLDLLISLLSKIKNENINVGLIFLLPIIGDEDYYDEITKRLKKLGLTHDVLFLIGERENGFEFWKVSDVFVRPTLTDMEGLSVKEALSLGIHVVASDVCVRPDECILFKNRDEDDLFKKVLSIYKSKKYKEKVMYNSSIDVAHETWRIYQSL